jgi:serine/threonine protein kinase
MAFVEKNRVGLKLYYNNAHAISANEFITCKKLKSLGLIQHTTYVLFQEESLFRIEFTELDVKIKINESLTVPMKNITVVLTQPCDTDLEKLPRTDFNITQFMNDITPFMKSIHQHKLVHMDLNPENIVKCGDTYKIIDIHLYDSDINPLYCISTPKYTLPNLYTRYLNGKQLSPKTLQELKHADFVNENAEFAKSLRFDKIYSKFLNTTYDPDFLLMKNDEYALALILHQKTKREDKTAYNHFIKQLIAPKPYFYEPPTEDFSSVSRSM